MRVECTCKLNLSEPPLTLHLEDCPCHDHQTCMACAELQLEKLLDESKEK